MHGAWIDEYDSQNKEKNITTTKNKTLLFFPCSVSLQNKHIIPHPVIATILNVILNIFYNAKNNNNMPVKFSKYCRKLTEIVTNCKFDFRMNFALNDGHLGHHLHSFNFVNQTCECFILIVCIIRPLNIDKNAKLKCFMSSFLVR